MKLVLAAVAAAALLSGCGSSSRSGSDLVWCVAPGEAVTSALKAQYPELRMSRAACDAVNEGSSP